MFDIGFWELIVVGIVALIAIGPDQLPKVAKQVGIFISGFQGAVAKVKNNFEREVDIVHSAQFPSEKKDKQLDV